MAGQYIRKKPQVPRLAPPDPVPFAKILRALRRHGYSFQGLADVCGVSRDHLYNILYDDVEPRYYTGVQLLVLYACLPPEYRE